jgi:hypothetical protein
MLSPVDHQQAGKELACVNVRHVDLWQKRDTTFLRAVAILIVFNSHLDDYYPRAQMATGGAVGNALFFALSSFGLVLSSRKRTLPFPDWCARRFLRLYPAIWMGLLVYWLPLELWGCFGPSQGFLAVLGNFFYPPWWFVQILLVFYPLGYALTKSSRSASVLRWLAGIIVLYLCIYFSCVDLSRWSVETLPFKTLSCLLAFVLGAWLALRNEEILYRGSLDWVLLFATVAGIYGHKFLMSKGLLPGWQCLQQFLLLPMVYYALKVSRSDLIQHVLMRSRLPAACLTWLSEHTLEIYMVHTALLGPVLALGLLFPLNVVALFALTLVLAGLTGFLAGKLRHSMEAW